MRLERDAEILVDLAHRLLPQLNGRDNQDDLEPGADALCALRRVQDRRPGNNREDKAKKPT